MRLQTVLTTLLAAAGAVALLGTAHGQATAPPAQPPAAATATKSSLSKADQKIVTDMAHGNMAEIEIGKLAQTKSQNDQVKTYAQQMIDDHTKAQAEVQQLASSKGVTLPTELDKKHKAMADKLSAMSGERFDKAYIAQGGVGDHKRMFNMLTSAHAKAKDPDVKQLTGRMLPTIEQHLKAAQQLGGAKGAAKADKAPASTSAGK